MHQRRLQCFVALAEELHFGRAASRSAISQPGLSQQIQQLEEHLQVQLFRRTKRQVVLTYAGEVFLPEARRLLASMDEAVQLARHAGSGTAGQLTVGTTSTALFLLLPELMQRFSAAFPRVRVTVRPMTTAEQEEALRRGDIHVGLVHPALDDRSIHCQAIATMPFDVVMSAANPLSDLPTLRLADLARERFILFPRQVGPKLFDQILALCQAAGFSPQHITEAAPAQSIVAMAACNLGIGFIASRLQHFSRPLAVYRRLEPPGPQLTIGIAFGGNNPVIRSFIDIAREVGAGLTSDPEK